MHNIFKLTSKNARALLRDKKTIKHIKHFIV
jgi:hypothetical protein